MQPQIYGSLDNTVALLDLPASIEHAQQLPYSVKSSPALQSPYSSVEPTGRKRETLLNAIPVDERHYHALLQEKAASALVEIREALRSQGKSWCLPRHHLVSEADLVVFTLVEGVDKGRAPEASVAPIILSATESRTHFSSLQSLHGHVVCNVRREFSVVDINSTGMFLIPPESSFVLGTLAQAWAAFSLAHRMLPAASNGFDLILMDPPWTNRSARRSRAYRTSEHQVEEPFTQAVSVVEQWLAPRGLVAIWVTNKTAVRREVLTKLQTLGFHLQEEWTWIKITLDGAPVTELDGIWRRPYEIMLLFQRQQTCDTPKRRIIAAVPDLHSRKPCLKTLFEERLPSEYRALELFARSLTAGWWSWGDEVLKFQHESHWARGQREGVNG